MVKLVLEVYIDEEFLKKVGRKPPESPCQFIVNLILEGGVRYGWWDIQPDWLIIGCREVSG